MSDTFHNACSHLIYHKHKIIVYFLLHNKADDRQQNSFENNGKIFPVITINNRVGYRKYIQCGACLAFSAAQNKLLRIHLLYKKMRGRRYLKMSRPLQSVGMSELM